MKHWNWRKAAALGLAFAMTLSLLTSTAWAADNEAGGDDETTTESPPEQPLPDPTPEPSVEPTPDSDPGVKDEDTVPGEPTTTITYNPDGSTTITTTYPDGTQETTMIPAPQPDAPVEIPADPEPPVVDVPVPVVDPPEEELDIPIPTPKLEEESSLQDIVKKESAVKWADRIELPDYAGELYDVLSGGLARDELFTLPAAQSGGLHTVEQVEQVNFDLAELFADGGPSLGASVFESDDFNRVDPSDSDRRVDYAALKPGDVVRTPDYNGIFITSVPRDGGYEAAKKTACSYVSTVFQAFDRDHPEVFWLSGKCQMRIPSSGGTAYFILVLVEKDGFTMRSPDWTRAGAVAQGIQRRDKAVEQILAGVTAKEPAEQVRQINRWLTEHNEYNTSEDLYSISNEPHECLAALEGRTGKDGPVCDGYSRAFKVLCDRLEIPCVLENGYADYTGSGKGTNHMWNAVEIGGAWYGVDVTWNDPTVAPPMGAKSGRENENYLLVGAATKIRGVAYAASHPATNRASADGVAFINGPVLSARTFASKTDSTEKQTFSDVPAGQWYTKAVDWAVDGGITNGTSSGKFSPGLSCTHEQILTFLYRAARSGGAASAGDMDAAVQWAREKDMIDSGFDGGKECTRAAAVTYIWQAFGSQSAGAGSGFADVPDGADYAEAVRWAVEQGITDGTGDGQFSPDTVCSRATIVTFLNRAYVPGARLSVK